MKNTDDTTIIDTRDGTTKSVPIKDFKIYDYYKGITSGKVSVIDKRDGRKKIINQEEFDNYDYYIGNASSSYIIYDKDNTIIFSVVGPIRKFIKQNKLPWVLEKATKDIPLYQKVSPSSVQRLKNNNNYQYKGWYITKEDINILGGEEVIKP